MKRLSLWKGLMLVNQPAQARGETGKFFIHAVFVYRLVFRHSRRTL
jgi:hypothetical protein